DPAAQRLRLRHRVGLHDPRPCRQDALDGADDELAGADAAYVRLQHLRRPGDHAGVVAGVRRDQPRRPPRHRRPRPDGRHGHGRGHRAGAALAGCRHRHLRAGGDVALRAEAVGAVRMILRPPFGLCPGGGRSIIRTTPAGPVEGIRRPPGDRMATERMIPLLPCGSIREMLGFYMDLGFTVTYQQKAPNVYAAVRRGEIELHFYVMKGHDSARNHCSCIVLVDDPEPLHQTFTQALKRARGRVPITGIPRLARWRKGQTRFNIVDPAGNWIRFISRDENWEAGSSRRASDAGEAPPSRLAARSEER